MVSHADQSENQSGKWINNRQPSSPEGEPNELKSRSLPVAHCAGGISIEGVSHLVQLLLPELRQRLEQDGCSLEGSYCRGASGTLKSMLPEYLRDCTETVQNRILHTFLMVRVPGQRATIVIDPTIRQFISEENRKHAPEVFVGSRKELKSLLVSCQVDSGVISNYFRGLGLDAISPVSPKLN